MSIEGACASSMYLWSFNTAKSRGVQEPPGAGDVILAIVGAVLPATVLICFFWFLAHRRILAHPLIPVEYACECEPARMEIKGEVKESKFWRIALGDAAWRPPRKTLPQSVVVDIKVRRHQQRIRRQLEEESQRGSGSAASYDITASLLDVRSLQTDNTVLATPEDPKVLAAIEESQFYHDVMVCVFVKQRGYVDHFHTSKLRQWLAEASARSLVNDTLINGALGLARGYALSDPCFRSEGSLIFVLVLSCISLIETALLRSYISPLRNLVDCFSAFMLFTASGLAVSGRTEGLAEVAVATVVLSMISALLHRILSLLAQLVFKVTLWPKSMPRDGEDDSQQRSEEQLTQLLLDTLMENTPTSQIAAATLAAQRAQLARLQRQQQQQQQPAAPPPPPVQPPPPPPQDAVVIDTAPAADDLEINLDSGEEMVDISADADIDIDLGGDDAAPAASAAAAAAADEDIQIDWSEFKIEGDSVNDDGDDEIKNEVANMMASNTANNGNDGDDDDTDVIELADGSIVPRRRAAREDIAKGEAWQSKETREDHLKRLLDELEEDEPAAAAKKKEPEKKADLGAMSATDLRAVVMAALKK